MAGLNDAIPIRWLSGPLEIARRKQAATLTPEIERALAKWHDPSTLDLLRGSPVDCLVVSWAAGFKEDAEQQRTLAPLVDGARKLGLSVAGWTEGQIDQNAVLAGARAAGLSAVLMGKYRGKPDPPVIACTDRTEVAWDAPGPVLAITGNVWPGVSLSSGGGGADAGPTSLPWLDSNSWWIQMARARVATPLWLFADPPGKGAVVLPQHYVLAICDAEAAGARWVISLDDRMRSELAAGTRASRESWRQIGTAAEFFRRHAEWRSYRPSGLTGVISDFTAENFDVSGEILNLMARRGLLFRVFWKSRALAESFAGLKALVYADSAEPEPALRRKMLSFAEQGGLLIAGPKWASKEKPAGPDGDTHFDVRAHGKGRIAAARGELPDAYTLAQDAQFLLSHRNDLVKIYNGSSSGCTSLTASPDGKRALLQSLSFATRRGGLQRSVWLRQKHRGARLSFVGAEPFPIRPVPADEYEGIEFHLPVEANTQPYFALELEA